MATAHASAGAAPASNDRRKRWLKLGAALLVFLGVLVTAIMLGIEHRQKKVASVSSPPPSEKVTTESVPAVTGTVNEVVKVPVTTTSTPIKSVEPPPSKASTDSSSSSNGEGTFFGLQPPGVVPAISETILGGAAVLAQAAGNSLDNACRVANAEELDDAITTKTCPVVILTSSERMAYVLTHEIVISRPVTEDDWRVPETEEEHRTLRTLQLGGQDAEANPGEVIDIRGGSVYFEPGAVGGTFNGVYFTSDQTSLEDIQAAIRLTVNLIGLRIWGGHVLVAGGDVSFNGCIFYDLELLTPFSDRIYFGGDVCVLAGMEFNAAAAFSGAGQAFLVCGGVQIVTGCSFSYFSATQFFAGTGELTVLAGVQIVTGVAWQEWYGAFAFYGAGLDYCVGAGVLVLTGATVNTWSGPIWGSVAGEYFFVGAGSFSAHGTPIADYSSIGGVTGSGCLGVSGPGLSSCDQTEACGQIQKRLASPGGLVLQDSEAFEDYKEHYVILADLDVTTPGVLGGLNETIVKEAMVALLAEDGDALETLHVTVSDTTPDSLLKATFTDGLPAEHEERRLAFHRATATDTHDLTQRFKIMVVATSKERSNSVLDAVKPSSASVASPLQDDLKTYLKDDEGVDVGALQLLYDRMLYIPAYNTKGLLDNDQNFLGGQTSAMGAFSVVLQDPAQPAVPINHAHYGSDNKYRVSLAHFPPSASVSLRLVRVGGGVMGQETSWPLSTVSVDENGAGEAAVAFQPLIHREGDYYIKATDVDSGIYNFSPVFTVEKGARRRKLYGPTMYF
eukprot:evm.model.NODE_12231_length_13929_cov_59.199226.2